MAKSWAEVEVSPDFQALGAEQKVDAKIQYWRDVVMAKPEFQAMPKDDQLSARKQFFVKERVGPMLMRMANDPGLQFFSGLYKSNPGMHYMINAQPHGREIMSAIPPAEQGTYSELAGSAPGTAMNLAMLIPAMRAMRYGAGLIPTTNAFLRGAKGVASMPSMQAMAVGAGQGAIQSPEGQRIQGAGQGALDMLAFHGMNRLGVTMLPPALRNVGGAVGGLGAGTLTEGMRTGNFNPLEENPTHQLTNLALGGLMPGQRIRGVDPVNFARNQYARMTESPEASVDRVIVENYDRAFGKPSLPKNEQNQRGLNRYNQAKSSVVNDIVDNSKRITFTENGQEVNRPPRTRLETLDVMDQRMRDIWGQIESKISGSQKKQPFINVTADIESLNPANYPKNERALNSEAINQAWNKAQEIRNIYGVESRPTKGRGKWEIKEVHMTPSEINDFIVGFNKQAQSLRAGGKMSPQDVNYYTNMEKFVGRLRDRLDSHVAMTDGQGIGPLKNLWGQYATLRKNVYQGATKQMGEKPGLLEGAGDLRVLEHLATGNLPGAAKAVAVKSGLQWYRYMNHPDARIQAMFDKAWNIKNAGGN